MTAAQDRSSGAGAEAAPAGGLLALYHAHRGELLRFLVARTRDAAEAEDLIQELWLRLQHARLGPVANGRAYLYQMANHLALDRSRERRRRLHRDQAWAALAQDGPVPVDEPVDPASRPDQAVLEAEELQQLSAAIGALPEAARRAFCLHKMDGLGHAEVARRLGISRSGVEKHIALAMKHLRRALLD